MSEEVKLMCYKLPNGQNLIAEPVRVQNKAIVLNKPLFFKSLMNDQGGASGNYLFAELDYARNDEIELEEVGGFFFKCVPTPGMIKQYNTVWEKINTARETKTEKPELRVIQGEVQDQN